MQRTETDVSITLWGKLKVDPKARGRKERGRTKGELYLSYPNTKNIKQEKNKTKLSHQD